MRTKIYKKRFFGFEFSRIGNIFQLKFFGLLLFCRVGNRWEIFLEKDANNA